MTQHDCVQYTCGRSGRSISAHDDGDAIWVREQHVAHLLGASAQQLASTLRRLRALGEIDDAVDLKTADSDGLLLGHRAVTALGYHLNFCCATAFREWCAGRGLSPTRLGTCT
jgi:hypothetical protein